MRFSELLKLLLAVATFATPLATASATQAQTAAFPSIEVADLGAPDPAQVACIAKVILHEAAYEPHAGRVAVAQVIRARVKSGRFAADACAVTKQRGQYFDVDAFDPPKNANWADAAAIAAATLSGAGDEVAPGALFFHTARSPMPGHQQVARIGGHVFYS